VDTTPQVSDRDIVVGSHDGSLYSLHPASGDVRWKRKNENISAIVSNDQMIFTSSAKGKIRTVNRSNGELLWEFTLDKGVPSAPEISRHALYVGSTANYVYAISLTGDEIWRYETGSGLTSKPVFDNDKLFFFTNYSMLHVLDPLKTVVARY